MKPNRVRQLLQQGAVPVGHMISEFGTRGIAKILEAAGADFALVDMEHSGMDLERVADLLAWFHATPVTPLVRVPQGLYHFVARVMDAGALGVMVPNVESAEQARAVVRAAKYAPLGGRGVGLGVAHTDYVLPDPVSYFREANEQTMVLCQIESVLGLENADEIASVQGVDVLWVGHFDLTQSMGIPGEFTHPRFVDALAAVVAAAKTYGKAAGIQPGSLEQAREWLALGFSMLSFGSDVAVYRDALAGALQAVRSVVTAGARG
ncbi:MAG: aldolase/citrate lyase family protein [Bryobacteraceae bacterium]|nr:aldolase/citrate lyase family protein [Bryobacteraceae bacterium]